MRPMVCQGDREFTEAEGDLAYRVRPAVTLLAYFLRVRRIPRMVVLKCREKARESVAAEE